MNESKNCLRKLINLLEGVVVLTPKEVTALVLSCTDNVKTNAHYFCAPDGILDHILFDQLAIRGDSEEVNHIINQGWGHIDDDDRLNLWQPIADLITALNCKYSLSKMEKRVAQYKEQANGYKIIVLNDH